MRLEVTIDGMLAVHAKHAVFMALAAVDGITHAEVELGRAELTVVRGAPGAVSSAGSAPLDSALDAAIRSAIADAGFAVNAIRILPRTLPTI